MWSTGAVSGTNDVNARFIRVLRRQFADQQRVRVQGPVSGCNGANPCTEPVIDGITVQITANTVFTVGTPADVVDGKTMHVRGSFDATSGKLVARAVAVRRLSDGVVTLLGSVSDFADDGATKNFRVRGVPVTANSTTTFGNNCSLTNDDNDKIVAVAGQISGSSVLAARIECPTLAVGTVVDAYGPINQLDANAKTFHITNRPLLGAVTLHWDDNTVFSNGATPHRSPMASTWPCVACTRGLAMASCCCAWCSTTRRPLRPPAVWCSARWASRTMWCPAYRCGSTWCRWPSRQRAP